MCSNRPDSSAPSLKASARLLLPVWTVVNRLGISAVHCALCAVSFIRLPQFPKLADNRCKREPANLDASPGHPVMCRRCPAPGGRRRAARALLLCAGPRPGLWAAAPAGAAEQPGGPAGACRAAGLVARGLRKPGAPEVGRRCWTACWCGAFASQEPACRPSAPHAHMWPATSPATSPGCTASPPATDNPA